MPRNFNGTAVETGAEIRVPFVAGKFLTIEHDPKLCCFWEIAGRLQPGISRGQAEAETVSAMRAAMLEAYARRRPVTDEDRREAADEDIRLEPIERGVSLLRIRFAGGLLTLLSGAVLLLVLACANIAGLLLARAAAREQEALSAGAAAESHDFH